MRKSIFVSVAVLFFCASSAFALPPKFLGKKPPELDGIISSSLPLGFSNYTFMFLRAFDISVWTDATTWSDDLTAERPVAISITYDIGILSSQILDRSIKEIKHDQPSLDDATLAKYREALTPLIPDVKFHDRITALYTNAGLQFLYNGTPTGTITDPVLASAFLGIWLSPQTSLPLMRHALLNAGVGV